MDPFLRQRALYDAIDARRNDLGWFWRDVHESTGVTYETFRALKDSRVRRMRASTKRQIEIGVGWEHGSVDAIETGGQPALRAGWRPFNRPGRPSQDDYERTLLAALGLAAADLAEAQQRYTAGHAWIRIIAESVAEVAGMDIDGSVRDLLFAAARNSIKSVFDTERREVDDFTQLREHVSKRPRGVDDVEQLNKNTRLG